MDLSDSAVMQFRARLVDGLYRHANVDAIIGIVAILAAGAIAAGAAPAIVVLLWTVVGVTSCCGRMVTGIAYKRATESNSGVTRWLRYGIIGAIYTGVVWGAFAGYVAYFFDLLRAGSVLFIVAMLALLSVVSCAGTVAATLGFSVCALVPPAVILLMRGEPAGHAMAGMLVVVGLSALVGARMLNRMVQHGVVMQNDIELLTGHLDQRRTQIEKLNVALKTNQDKREQAEMNLRKTAADLGLVQGKARALADTLERVSPICQVTALSNRRSFENHVGSEWRRAIRDDRPLSMAVIGIDEYDEFLAAYGRQSSDILLKKIAMIVKSFGRRAGDLAGRYEEARFALVLQNCDAANSLRIAEAIRQRVAGLKIAHAGAKNRPLVTTHIGVATITPSRALDPEQIYKRVDTAAYEAQFQGGNKVVSYQPLSRLRLERWDAPSDGHLSEQSMTQKLLVWGYDTEKTILPPGTSSPNEVSKHEAVISILTGQLKFTIEGHSMVMKPGDCIFVPEGITMNFEVVGDHPVVKFRATKSK